MTEITSGAHPAPSRSLRPVGADGPLRGEFDVQETHGIALWPENRLMYDSQGLGWRDAYTSVASERSWQATLPASRHICLAYCMNRSALVQRQIEADRWDAAVELLPRRMGIVPENRQSSWNLAGTPDIQLVYLHRDMFQRVAREVLGIEDTSIELVPGLGFFDPFIEQMMLGLQGAAMRREIGIDGLYVDHVARSLALHLLLNHSNQASRRRVASPGPKPTAVGNRRVRHACELIEAALDEVLSIERLAAACDLTAHAFSSAFLRAVGTTPHQYVLSRRIEKAKLLLRKSQLTIAEVALETGFASHSHLATAFKRATGMTPRGYQRDSPQ